VNTTNRFAALLPRTYRRRLINARLTARRWTDRRRPLPLMLIIGAQRSGTSSLYKWLEAHPDVAASVRKETEYLTRSFQQGEVWYRSHFASRFRHKVAKLRHRPLVTFEATPTYLSHPLAPERAAALVPGAKLIVLLRNPVTRAVSQYEHERSGGREPMTIDDAIAAEADRVGRDLARLAIDPMYNARDLQRYSYLTRGRYAEQLERWFEKFDRSRVLVVRSEDMYDDPAKVYAEILDFLGLRRWQPRQFVNQSYLTRPDATSTPVEVSDETRAWLRDYFRPHNVRLKELLGRDFDWD